MYRTSFKSFLCVPRGEKSLCHPIGVLYDAPFDVYLTDTDVFQPDLLVVLNQNRGILTDAGAEGAPDFVVEVLSSKTRQLDLVNKKRIYARMGVKELWIIDPEPKEVAIYRFDQDPIQVRPHRRAGQ